VTLNGGKLFGFLNGTKGIFEQKYIEITEENFSIFRNQGGYHFLGRSADKIRSETELIKTLQTCSSLNLSGLVLIGASHTFTDAAYLTNYFIQNNQNTCVITVPCTIDNNVGHHMLEQSVGFDSAAKVYSQLVGNIMIDSASAVKYWYFMRLMGRDPSHLVSLGNYVGFGMCLVDQTQCYHY
jgi:6-phosphofructokinase